MSVTILKGDCREVLRTLPEESVHCIVTSPPYWGLREYGVAPGIWTNHPACTHEWGEEVVDRSRRSPGTAGSTLTNNGRFQAEACRFELRSNFCARCDGWRGCFGLEPTYQLYVDHAVEIFREVWRVLRQDGTLWLNLGDSYATGAGKVGDHPGGGAQGSAWAGRPAQGATATAGYGRTGRKGGTSSKRPAMGKQAYLGDSIGIGPSTQPNRLPQPGLKPKDLCGIPWRVAFALQADGWWLRQDIIWSKPNPMPESVTDRCTKAHEYLFLFSKSERYYFDQDAILEECSPHTHARLSQDVQSQIGSDRAVGKTNGNMKAVARRGGGNRTHKHTDAYNEGQHEHRTKEGLVKFSERQRKLAEAGSGIKNNDSFDAAMAIMPIKRNKRSVWEVTTQPFSEAHFATFPPALIEPCILAGCPSGGTTLDPFFGAGTTGLVADRLGRNCIGIELNEAYAEMARLRIQDDAPLFTEVA